MSEPNKPELLPCPFSGFNKATKMLQKFIDAVVVFFGVCGAQGKTMLTNRTVSAAIDGWNCRVPASPQWTTEPPKEGGFYAMHWGVTGIYDARFLEDEGYMKGKSRQEKINFVQKSLSIAYPGALWIKLDVPPLP